MAQISKDAALERLARHIPVMRNAQLAAWQQWLELPIGVRMATSTTTRAGVIHDLAIAKAALLFEPDVRLVDLLGGLRVFVFDGSIAVRFKKLDSHLCSRNQPTQQVANFKGQQTIPGFELTHNLELGYILNAAQREIESIHLVCPSGNRGANFWSAELGERVTKANVVDLFDNVADLFDKETAEDDVGKTVFISKTKSDPDKVVPIVKTSKEDGDRD